MPKAGRAGPPDRSRTTLRTPAPRSGKHNALDVARHTMIASERPQHGSERVISVRDQGCDVDRPAFYEFQSANIRGWPAVGLEPTRATGGGDQRRFQELELVQNAQGGAFVPVTIQQDSRLLANQPGNRGK